MIAQPLLRKYVEGREDHLTEEQAKQIIQECMKVLFYRDARSLNKVCANSAYPITGDSGLTVCSTKWRRLRRRASRSPSRSLHPQSGRSLRRLGVMAPRLSR